MSARRLMAVLAHPDDESLGFGGTLAKYASEGAEALGIREVEVLDSRDRLLDRGGRPRETDLFAGIRS
jgi:LmbE family N-acetylglucosaminyl deacetylase